MKKLLFVAITLTAAACGQAQNASNVASSVDQASGDSATLAAKLGQAISLHGGSGSTELDQSQCEVTFSSPYYRTLDCTKQVETLFGAPAMMPFVVNANVSQDGTISSQYYCRVAEITTVTKAAAVASPIFRGLGFWNNETNLVTEIAKARLVKGADVTLKSGEAAVTHKFLGYAGCWHGSSSSSASHVMSWKGFAAFETGADSYHNWETISKNHGLGAGTYGWDRSVDLLK